MQAMTAAESIGIDGIVNGGPNESAFILKGEFNPSGSARRNNLIIPGSGTREGAG